MHQENTLSINDSLNSGVSPFRFPPSCPIPSLLLRVVVEKIQRLGTVRKLSQAWDAVMPTTDSKQSFDARR